MINKEKKVILFIVEGVSDENALGSIMKKYFIHSQVRFLVIHGDITTHDFVNMNEIIKKINKNIETISQRYRYNKEDINRIIHLVDMDGVCIPDSAVIFSENVGIQYNRDGIRTKNVKSIQKRNHLKSQVLYKLRKTSNISDIPYNIYYMSCNLEHVLFNNQMDFTDEDKMRISDQFAERFDNNMDEFIKFIMNQEIAVNGNYNETWKFIEKNMNSLNRYTNLHLLF